MDPGLDPVGQKLDITHHLDLKNRKMTETVKNT